MTDTRVKPINLYGDTWDEAEREMVVGQEPVFTLDGNIASGQHTALVRGAEYDGDDLILEVQLPEGVYAADLSDESPHPVTIGYVRGADRVLRLHTLSRSDQVPTAQPSPAQMQGQEVATDDVPAIVDGSVEVTPEQIEEQEVDPDADQG
jgi:hypothetical protein